MEFISDNEKEWKRFLENGDAASLIAVFRETASSELVDKNFIKYISEFLQSHLFTSALKVNLSKLCSTVSIEYLETILQETSYPILDSREVLTELLSIKQFNNAYIIEVYLKLLRITLRQVLLDTIRRRKECTSAEEKISKSLKTMLAWCSGVSRCISNIILIIFQRDALPKMVKTVSKFHNENENENENADEENDNNNDDNDNDESQFSLTLFGPNILEALLYLSLDFLIIVGDIKKAMPLLLIIRTTFEGTEIYNNERKFLNKVGNDLKQWANKMFKVNDVKSELNVPNPDKESSSLVLSENEFKNLTKIFIKEILNYFPKYEILSFLIECSSNEFRKNLLDSVTYEDNERGKDLNETKRLTKLHDLKKEKDSLRVLSDEDSSEEEEENSNNNNNNNNNCSEILSFQKVGSMLIFYDLLKLNNSYYGILFSNSPTTLFFSLGPMILESLKNSSLNIVMIGLTFLSILVPHIPLYSICVYGELNVESTLIQEFEFKKNNFSSTINFHTRKYEFIFELIKSLLNISATCPSESHREIARAIFTILLQRCVADLRMLIYSSFLVLTPFASICSIMLYSLQNEWNNSQTLYNQSEYLFLRKTLPCCLFKAQENWLRQLRIGEISFLNPLIQSLNFIRLVISENSQNKSTKDSLFKFDKTYTKVQLCKISKKNINNNLWEEYLCNLMKEIVPKLRTMVISSSNESSSTSCALSLVKLSPLDCFGLSMVLDGLEHQVEFIE